VRTLRWDTVIPSRITNPYITPEKIFSNNHLKNSNANYMCASACFFIFVAGIVRSTDELGITDNDDDGILGIHRPYLTDNELRTLSGDQAIASADKLRVVVASANIPIS
jgi:hypothetical protein